MLPANTPSATASQLLDLYLSLQAAALVGPEDLQSLGVEPAELNDLKRRVPVRWSLHLWQCALRRGAPAKIGLQVGQRPAHP